ncbi:prolyl oligopeptidase family protein [Acidovorax sp. CF316]|uniref:S9 family peptidase n=1 Tax=Acidovorax sp. CF316 TaxID=1144317 RepID=UPI00026BDAB3|nr:prolyl oligopeptidase family serine peptidase [Acidovorax sp. CF316]EJE53901.1 prolyl oligopeptidase family protein [Acidovorax sp. CF316]
MSATSLPTHHSDPRPLAIADVLRLHTFHESHGSGFAFAPDGATLAFCMQRPLAQATRHADSFFSGIARGELHTVDLATQQVRRLDVPYDCFAPAWSPCGQYLAFGMATADGASIRMGWVPAGEAIAGGAQQPTIPDLGNLQLMALRPFDWIGDGLLACACVPDGGSPWMAGLDSRGARKAAAFWQTLDVPGHTAISVLASGAGEQAAACVPASADLAHLPRELVIYDVRRGQCVPLAGHEDTPAFIALRERLASGRSDALERLQWVWAGEVPAGGAGELVALHAASGQALFLVQDGLGSRLVLAGQGAGTLRELFRTNTHLAEVQAGEVRDVDFTGSDGQPRKARVLLPPACAGGSAPWPAVAWVYPGAVAHPRPRPCFGLHDTSQFNMQLLAARGYAVIDVPLPLPATPGPLDLAAVVAQATQEAMAACVATGLVDPARLHVYGHSHGGWAAMALLATTGLFRSGIAAAGISNLVSFHGAADPRMRYDDGIEQGSFALAEMCERIFRLDGPPWKDLDRYVRNSPVMQAERITAPLLIVQGDQDFVPIPQGEEMFSALVQLRKEVQFVRYWGEGHVLAKPVHLEDLWTRMFAWLDAHGARGASGQGLYCPPNHTAME